MIKVNRDAPDRPADARESYERKPFDQMSDTELFEALGDALSDYVNVYWETGGYAPSEILTKHLYLEAWKRCGRIER